MLAFETRSALHAALAIFLLFYAELSQAWFYVNQGQINAYSIISIVWVASYLCISVCYIVASQRVKDPTLRSKLSFDNDSPAEKEPA